MSLITMALVGFLAWQCPVPGAVHRFPESFAPDQGEQLRRQALQYWPGPTSLVSTWHDDKLNENQQVSLLIAAAGFHDRDLLPLYREALGSDSRRLRLAAVYGYRTLLGDLPPPTHVTITDEQVALLDQEMADMQATLRLHPLVSVWLAAALHSEGSSLPGWTGVLMTRPAISCFRAIEQIVEVEDLPLLLDAYSYFHRRPNRIPLLRLIEGLSLSRFIVKPAAGRIWGPEIYRTGEQMLLQWWDQRCQRGYDELLQERFAAMGAGDIDPLSADACSSWQDILVEGDPEWWLLATRQLYRCGAPSMAMSVLQADSDSNRSQRDHLLAWYGLRGEPTGQPVPARRPPRRPLE